MNHGMYNYAVQEAMPYRYEQRQNALDALALLPSEIECFEARFELQKSIFYSMKSSNLESNSMESKEDIAFLVFVYAKQSQLFQDALKQNDFGVDDLNSGDKDDLLLELFRSCYPILEKNCPVINHDPIKIDYFSHWFDDRAHFIRENFDFYFEMAICEGEVRSHENRYTHFLRNITKCDAKERSTYEFAMLENTLSVQKNELPKPILSFFNIDDEDTLSDEDIARHEKNYWAVVMHRQSLNYHKQLKKEKLDVNMLEDSLQNQQLLRIFIKSFPLLKNHL